MNLSYKYNQNNMSQFDRLNRISDKLNSTSISPNNSKFQFLQSRVADLNEHLDEVVDQTTKKFNIIKENVKINFYKKTIL